MNSKVFYSILVFLVVVILFGYLYNPNNNDKSNTAVIAGSSALSPQVKDMGAVKVEVIPKRVESGSEALFTLNLNTHSVDLGYNYTKIIKLTDDKGNQYYPIKWTGSSGGHHLSGEISFGKINKGVRKLILTISGIDNKTAEFVFEL